VYGPAATELITGYLSPCYVFRSASHNTVGWAATTCDTSTAPSEHPDRRRVHLITITSRRQEAAALLTFHDETENEITFAAGGTGQLADALHNAMRFISLWAKPSPPTNPCLGIGKLIT
jgi:hypothetical protein